MEVEGYRWQDLERMAQNRTGGGLLSVAYAPPRCNRRKQVSKILLFSIFTITQFDTKNCYRINGVRITVLDASVVDNTHVCAIDGLLLSS
jgi:hypothetical protein